MGGNAVRLGALFGGPVLAAVVLARRPRVSVWFLASLHGRRPLLAGDRERQPDRPQRRRSLDLARLLPPRRPLAARARRPRRPGRGAADRQPLGVGLPGAAVRARPRLAAAARHDPRRHLLRRRRPLTDRRLQLLAARQRDPLRRPPRRAARLLLGGRAAADPARPALSRPALGSPHWRVYAVRNPEPLVEPIGAAAARTRWIGRQSFGLDVTSPGQFLVRVNFTQYWSIARGGLPDAPRRLDRGPRRPPRHLPVSADFSLAGPGTPSPAPRRPADPRRVRLVLRYSGVQLALDL